LVGEENEHEKKKYFEAEDKHEKKNIFG